MLKDFFQSNLFKRMLLTTITVPVVFLTLFFPLKSHIFLVLIFGFVITYLGSFEINSLIFNKGIKVNRHFIPGVNLLIYIFAYIYANNYFSIHSYPQALPLFFLFLISLLSFVYARDIFAKDLTASFEKIAYTLFGILYIGIPSFVLPFLLNIDPVNKLADVPNVPIFYCVKSQGTQFSAMLVIFLTICIWVNDIFAYVFGMTFGRKKKLGITASPNKSLAGYIGGYLTTFAFVGVYYGLFHKYLSQMPVAFYFLFPILSGFLVPIGDLVESVVKRSANVKDSGHVIMGRGGVLDSVDTLLFLLPIYFVILQVYFSFIVSK